MIQLARIMQFTCAFFICFALLLGCKTKSPASAEASNSASTVTDIAPEKLEQSILEEVNAYRKKKSLAPLRSNSVIATEASVHSQAMARKTVVFGHAGFGGRIKRISTRLGGIVGSAENVAVGNMTAKQVVQRWVNSAPHRKNLEGNFNLTGIGVSKDFRGQFYYTQIFIRN